MCGIIGYVGKKPKAINVLFDGLDTLAYQGYDSVGITYKDNNDLVIVKENGKIKDLKTKIDFSIKSKLGLGHTRFATMGVPNFINTHPHKVGKITIVHNGVIENHDVLKDILIQSGYKFVSDTDTEVACALINKLYNERPNLISVLEKCQTLLHGSYSLGIICDDDLETIYAISKKHPLFIGIGENEHYLTSDISAFLKYTNKYMVLDNNDIAEIKLDKVTIYNNENNVVKKEILTVDWNIEVAQKSGYEHFMLKEIYEQPQVVQNIFSSYLFDGQISLIQQMPDFQKYENIYIVACGSSYFAGLIGKSLIEKYGNVPVSVEIASEFRQNKLFLNKKTLVIAISQSGETADTLAALKVAKQKNVDTLAIVNIVGSSIARNAKYVLYLKAGSEIAIATTKAFSAQVSILSLIALNIAIKNNKTIASESEVIFNDMLNISKEIKNILDDKKTYQNIAKLIYENNHVFFTGRGIDYALSLEGALKLKETSYIHGDAYPTGELKHGTISLFENNTPVIAVATDKSLKDKTINNMREFKARGANVIFITTCDLNKKCDSYNEKIIIPSVHGLIQPLLTVVSLQLIAYETAKLRKCDIDSPRNLTKYVTTT